MSRTALSRLEREALQRREARKCATEGRHPHVFWQAGDYATPDRLVCGRCFATLLQQPHSPARQQGQ
jgi:hypothetical protein